MKQIGTIFSPINSAMNIAGNYIAPLHADLYQHIIITRISCAFFVYREATLKLKKWLALVRPMNCYTAR